MTAAGRQMAEGWFDIAFKVVMLIAAMLGIGASIYAYVAWNGGGLKPHAQEVQDSLSQKVDDIKKVVEDIKTTVNGLPHPYEFEEQRKHFTAIDQALGEDQAKISGLDARVGALEGRGGYRNPPSAGRAN